MKHITLSSEQVRISFDDEVDKNYNINVRGSITYCLKHVYRYNEFHIPKDIMTTILLHALKGCACNEDHLDISQRRSLYNYLKDKNVSDPYIQQFIKETERRVK